MKSKVYFIVLKVFITSLAFGQSDEINLLVKSFNTFQSNTVSEKLFVHTDRNFYVTGEVLWFKIYCTEAATNVPLDISKVAYLEIMSSEHKAVAQTKVALSEGLGEGSLFLPASINSGNYVLRVYTNWMKNSDPEFYFHQQISIVNTFKNLEPPQELTPAATANHVAFFPEGGNLVAGLNSTVAFKITDANARGVNMDGIVLGGRDTVARFTTHRFGMGTFNFTPQAGQVYEAMLPSDKSKTKYKLPVALESGCTMRATESETKISIAVQSTYESATPLYMIVHNGNVIKAAKSNVVVEGKAMFVFNKEQVGSGTIHLNLFDNELNPIGERLLFIRPIARGGLSMATDKNSYNNRQKISLRITTGDSIKGKDFSASISVRAYDSLLNKPLPTITSSFGFLAELRGLVESPEYYVSTGDAEVARALDNLMLVHGWSRYSWNSILGKEDGELIHLPELRGHLITGKIINGVSGKPMPEVIAVLGTPNKVIRSYTSSSDEEGNIYFEMKDFFDAQRIFVQALPEDDSVKIQINDPFSQRFSSFAPSPFKLSPATESALVKKSVAMQSSSIFQPAYKGIITPLTLDSINFYGKADEDYLLDDYTRFKSMEEIFREYVPGIFIKKRGENFSMRVSNKTTNRLFEKHPLVLLDGVPIFDANKVMLFDPLKIKRLEVMTRPYYIGPYLADGVVSLTSYRGLAEGMDIDPNAVALDYEGLQRRHEFYSPDYSTVVAIQNRQADFRDLLFWNPNVRPGKDGNIQLEFYSSDAVGKYEINFQGLSKQGNLYSSKGYFSVSK